MANASNVLLLALLYHTKGRAESDFSRCHICSVCIRSFSRGFKQPMKRWQFPVKSDAAYPNRVLICM